MKTFFTNILTIIASFLLALTIATIANLNAVFTTLALDEAFEETTPKNPDTTTQSNTAKSSQLTTIELAESTSTAPDTEISPDITSTDILPNTSNDISSNEPSKESLQHTVEQIEADPTYQDYTRVFDLIEQAQNLTNADRATENALKSELLSAVAQIGGGKNFSANGMGDFQTQTLDEILKNTSLIAHYQEYYELATLVKTAQKTLASGTTSTKQISQILETTTSVAKKVDISVESSVTKQSTTTITRADQTQDKTQTSSATTTDTAKSDITTIYSVNRPSSFHAETTPTEENSKKSNNLVDALAHTATTCVAFGTLMIGKLNTRRQK